MPDPSAAKRRRQSSDVAAAHRHQAVELRARLPYISQAALTAILRVAESEGLPAVLRAASIRQGRNEYVTRRTPFGPIHCVIKDSRTGTEFEIQQPWSMLYEACRVSSGIAHLVSALPESSVSKPLSLCFYADEITPGNQLSYRNQRRSWGCHWSIYEFGAAALTTEDQR